MHLLVVLVAHALAAPLLRISNGFYSPISIAITPTISLPSHVNPPTTEQLQADAVGVLANSLGVDARELKVGQFYIGDDGVQHLYATRLVRGREVSNQHANTHIKDGKVLSMQSTFTSMSPGAPLTKHTFFAAKNTTLEQAVEIASKELGAPRDDIPATMEYLEKPDGTLALVHGFQLRLKKPKNPKFYHVFVDASSGEIRQVVSYIKRSGYNVVQIPKRDPTDGFTWIASAADPVGSPLGWHNDGNATYTSTKGNNVNLYSQVDAVANLKSKESPLPSALVVDGGVNLEFNSAWNANMPATSPENRNAGAIHLFYIANFMHDLSYKYGFTEAAGNFQTNNFGKGGEANDAAIVVHQSSEGTDNAYMEVPPDGQAGRLVMFLFDMTNPTRDGSLESDIPIHEFTHGITNRMTGGSRSGACLSAKEANGLGEGWSDSVAMFLLRTAKSTRDDDFLTGTYVLNGPGSRTHPYSTDMTRNPWVFANLEDLTDEHDMGEIWASILNEVYWNLVEAHGYSADWMDSSRDNGNIIAMRLLFGGLTYQPCNPTFIQARDAILATDEHTFNYKYKCLIWKAFAKRGMGLDAKVASQAEFKGYTNGFNIPAECG